MAASRICCVHLFPEESGVIKPISEVNYRTLCEKISVWSSLDGKEQVLAQELSDRTGICADHQGDPLFALPAGLCMQCLCTYGYHQKCYAKFTDKSRIEVAKKRIAKGHPRKVIEKTESESLTEIRPSENAQESQQLLRSFLSSGSREPRSKYGKGDDERRRGIYPDICIICNETRYTKARQSGKRGQESLVTCQTYNASNALKEVAKKTNDPLLLVRIEGVDLVAKEAKYHKSCYRELCRKETATEKESADVCYDKAFQVFLEKVVVDRLINGHEVLRMNLLVKLFKDTVQEIYKENPDSWTYRNHQLKRRMAARYPQLMFVKSGHRRSELVLCEPDDNEPRFVQEKEIVSGTDTEIEDEAPSTYFQGEILRNLYGASQYLKTALKEAPSLPGKWPPTAHDLSEEAAQTMIPAPLFNFLAWCVGESDELTIDQFVKLSADVQRKLLSIAQDILYLSSKGRKTTPKHLALGMTIRHLTGSSEVIGILNGLGHSNSHSSVLEHDTALAELQLKLGDNAPANMKKAEPTIIVWDNNDFGEETVTGCGTTHNTNGLMVQQGNEGDQVSVPDVAHTNERNEGSAADIQIPLSSKKSKRRTLNPPVKDISFYHCSKKKQGPPTFQEYPVAPAQGTHYFENSKAIDAAYIISKFPQVSTASLLPGWTGFNTQLQANIVPRKSQLAYLPVIDASPTDMSTVNTVLIKSLHYADELELDCITLVFDQAIYCKAQQVRWRNILYQQRLVIRLGAFHTTMCFLSVIGKRFKDAGLQDILIESGIVAAGSINGVLSGHHYNRSMRCHKLLFEALQRLCWQEYLNSIPTEEVSRTIEVAMEMHNSVYDDETSLHELIATEEFKTILEGFGEYTISQAKDNKTFAFWISYIRMVELLLLFTRATREGNWELHLATLKNMIPWFFAYDKFNYSRYAPVYLLEMERLQQTHPSVHAHLSNGGFVVQRQDNYGFSSIACDQAIEQTVNRDSKTKGGLTGITLNKGAVHRWILSHPSRAEISKKCLEMAGKAGASRTRKDLDKTRITKDEQAVQSIISAIESMSNPFNVEEDGIVNIASGSIAPLDVQDSLNQAEERGKKATDEFIETRLLGEEKDIFLPIKLLRLKTFSDIIKIAPSKDKSSSLALKASSNLLGRMLVIGKAKKLDMKDVLTYSLHPFPPAIANHGGSLAKTVKAKLRNYLEAIPPDNENQPQPALDCVWILDGMALIQQTKDVPATFGSLAKKLFNSVVSIAVNYSVKRIDFVTDCYPEISIKGNERDRRASSGATVMVITRPEQPTPRQFKKFLASGKNKERLAHFLHEQWSRYEPHDFKGVHIFVTHGPLCHSLKVEDGILQEDLINDLCSDHEEADTRMFLHAKHASMESSAVVIRSEDTDVFVLAVALSSQLECDLFVHVGPWSESRTISIKRIREAVGDNISQALIGLHCFTGCDSISAFKGKGKLKPVKLMKGNPEFQNLFQTIGQGWDLEQVDLQQVERFVCMLYGKDNLDSVNAARFEIFQAKFKTDTALPPNRDALVCHTKRANYQAAIHRRSLLQNMNAPSPTTSGWNDDNGFLSVVWNTMEIAPDALLKNIACNCKKRGCADKSKCSCRENGVRCTELCKCVECTNVPPPSEDDLGDENSTSENDDDTDICNEDDDDDDDDDSSLS